MTANSSNEKAVLVARSVLSAIQNLNARKKGVNVKEISELIQSDPDMANILTPSTQLEKFHQNEALRQKKELETASPPS
jgi:DNA-binding transcriptional MerR regulator